MRNREQERGAILDENNKELYSKTLQLEEEVQILCSPQMNPLLLSEYIHTSECLSAVSMLESGDLRGNP